MRSLYRIHIALLCLFFIIQSALSYASDSNSNSFKHKMQFQLFDEGGFPVDGTEFWVELSIHKQGNKVNISFPAINFQVGPPSPEDPYAPPVGPGFLRTVNGFLPEHLCPSDALYRSYMAPLNTGQSLAFSYLIDPSEYTVPPGCILSVTFFGGIYIQAAGMFDNLFPPGPQVMLPTDIFYYHETSKKLCKNFPLSVGSSNITAFTDPRAEDDGYRDSQVNDAFEGVAAWSWSDNSMVADKTNGTMNLMVAIGKKDKKGKLKVRKPIQLTDLPPEMMVWDTAVAINRTNKNNIVVSYGVLDHTVTPTQSATYRAVSFDGGKTWPDNGPTNIQPTGIPAKFGDNRGVASDKFGNIWYCTTNSNDNLGNANDQLTFWVSPDGGVTFTVAYTLPFPAIYNFGVDGFDYPQFCFGADGLGNYGIWFSTDYYISYGYPFTVDIVPYVGFLPITGAMSVGGPVPIGTIPASTPSILFDFVNTQYLPCLTASSDGRVWCQSYSDYGQIYLPYGFRFKSPPNATYPDPVTSNYAGWWQEAIVNDASAYVIANTISYPGRGYFNSVQTMFYDDKRQALYSLLAQQAPDDFGNVAPPLAQNMRMYLLISRNNGQTWSQPFYISTTDFANRGFQSMALDTVTGDLLFGWYDGRKDPTYKSVQYWGSVLPSKTLDKLVNTIPLSNPLFMTPSSVGGPPDLVTRSDAANLQTKGAWKIKRIKDRIKRLNSVGSQI